MEEDFLRRWSRLKREAPVQQPAGSGSEPLVPAASAARAAPQLPAVESLEFTSDFAAFMPQDVDHELRRAALGKLFRSDHFNVMDGLDVYVDDYNSFEPVGGDLLRNLNQARGLVFDEEAIAAEDSVNGTTRGGADKQEDLPESCEASAKKSSGPD